MLRDLGTTLAAAAIYGFAAGAVHSLRFSLRNLVKLPLLLLTTALVCGVAYFLFARLVGTELRFREVQRLSLRLFRDAAVLLAAVAPACLFLALTTTPPDATSLREYPLVLGLNVGLIAVCGSVALVRQGRALLHRHALGLRRSLLVVACWLAVSLLVGGQAAWYLRPFFGVRTVPAPFCLGRAPDYRGATSFYEAVYQLVRPPPLPPDYARRGRVD